MGNNVTSDSSPDASCGLNFFSTESLRKSSLRSLKTSPNLSRIPSQNEKTAETKNTDISTLKDVSDTPDSTVEVKAFPSPDRVPGTLTEKDFRILEVPWNFLLFDNNFEKDFTYRKIWQSVFG